MVRQIALNGRKKTIFAAVMAATLLSLSFSACGKKEADSVRVGDDADVSVSANEDEAVFDAEAVIEKLSHGVSSSLTVEYSYEKRTGGVTNRGSAAYELAFAQSGTGAHMQGSLVADSAGEESRGPVDVYVSLQPENGQADTAGEAGAGAAQTSQGTAGTEQGAASAAMNAGPGGAMVYTLNKGGTDWSAMEVDVERASWYGLDGLFSTDAEWKCTDEDAELDGINVMEVSASFDGEAASRLLEPFPGDDSTEEIMAALQEAGKDGGLSADVTVYINKENMDELAGVEWDFGDSLGSCLEGTVFEGTVITATAKYRAFAYGDIDVSVPEAFAADAGALEGHNDEFADYGIGTPNMGGTPDASGMENETGADGMVDTGDYEQKAAEVREKGVFTLSSAACEAKAEIKNPDGLECAFASDESVHFSDESMLTTLNYGLYPKQYYTSEAIADMVAEWVDYLEESHTYSQIKMSDVSKVTFEGREYSCRTVSFVTTENTASSIYAWCEIKPDALLVIQLQVMGADGELDAGTVLASYAAGIKD
jgi:hypothetical protein